MSISVWWTSDHSAGLTSTDASSSMRHFDNHYDCTEQEHGEPSCTILVVRVNKYVLFGVVYFSSVLEEDTKQCSEIQKGKMSTESGKHALNFESAILFMQKEHAKTLRDLHEEIYRLQKLCADLTFQLTMRDVLTEKPDAADNKMQEMQTDLENSSTFIDTLQKELGHRDKRIEQLEAEAQSHKKRNLDKNRKHVQTMNALYAELKSKTNQISYLNSELHRFQCLKKQSIIEETNSKQGGIHADSGIPAEANYLYSDPANRFQTTLHYIPKPPSNDILYPISDTSTFRRFGHRRSIIRLENAGKSFGTNHTSTSTLMERQLKPQHLASDSISDLKAPDATPFLQHTEMVDVKQVPVLPPIPATSSKPIAAKYITPPS